MRTAPILEVADVVKRFGGIRAVDGATLDVEPGSITALIGPNGAGKTTLFNVMTGFYRGEHGSITFSKEQIFGRPPHAIARLGMVRTFQITKALARMPVIDNMMLAAPDQPGEKLRNVVFRPRACASREAEVRKQAMELLELFNLAPARRRVRGHALRRSAQAARAGARAHDRPAHAAARRADGRHQPDARAPAARAHAAAARRSRASPSCSSSTTWRS